MSALVTVTETRTVIGKAIDFPNGVRLNLSFSDQEAADAIAKLYNDLINENAALREERDALLIKRFTPDADRIAELEAENEALRDDIKRQGDAWWKDRELLRADAERYRWLRNPTNADVFICPTDTCEALDLEELDAAIDAARQEGK